MHAASHNDIHHMHVCLCVRTSCVKVASSFVFLLLSSFSCGGGNPARRWEREVAGSMSACGWAAALAAACFACLVVWRYVVRARLCQRSGLRALASHGGAAVLVTGCDSGFGKLIALELHRLGATVFAGCLTQSGCDKLSQQYGRARMRAFQLNVTLDADVVAAVKLVEDSGLRLAAVVNNAGISAFGWAEALDVKTYMRNMDVNFFGVVRVTRAFLPLLRKSTGRLINMGSIGARMPSAFGSAYLSTKAAMCSYSDSVRQEVSRFGVKVSLIEPGFFSTSLLDSGAADGGRLSVDPPGSVLACNPWRMFGTRSTECMLVLLPNSYVFIC